MFNLIKLSFWESGWKLYLMSKRGLNALILLNSALDELVKMVFEHLIVRMLKTNRKFQFEIVNENKLNKVGNLEIKKNKWVRK